jgi:3-deoxy-manno-octulosonate cytidylyltransferase (CMP-KDO synthetase)
MGDCGGDNIRRCHAITIRSPAFESEKTMRTLIVIPARINSSRLPRKLLLAETGQPLICYATEQAVRSGHDVIVASDSPEILNTVRKVIGRSCSITGEHPNGTSRAAELAQRDANGMQILDGHDAYCVVQADYPEIPPALIDAVIDGLEQYPEWDCATAAVGRFRNRAEYEDENRVKVMRTVDGIAIDFARKPPAIPGSYVGQSLEKLPTNCLHIGIYCYRRAALLHYAAAGPCEREQAKSLEQLRALDLKMKMGVVLWPEMVHGIDTREDYEAFKVRQLTKVAAAR